MNLHGMKYVVELGCGLSTRAQRLRHLHVQWIDVDLPGIIDARRRLGAAGRQISCSVLDDAWLQEITEPERTLLVAEGLLYYLPRADVDGLFERVRRRLGGAWVLFDVLGRFDIKNAERNSRAAGAPILWGVSSFRGVYRDLGIDQVSGWEPDAILHRALELCRPRFGRAAYWSLKLLAKVGPLADWRSGTVAGRIRPES